MSQSNAPVPPCSIPDKRTMYRLYERGLFGNRLRTWKDVRSYLDSGFQELVVMRYAGASGGAWFEFGLTMQEVPSVVERWKSEGADPDKIKLNELAQDDLLLFQGELRRSERFIDLRYTTVPLPMRKALAVKQCHSDGATAVALLRNYIDPSSLDDMWELLDEYPDSVIEFSVWEVDVGTCRGRNTVFWEVRNY